MVGRVTTEKIGSLLPPAVEKNENTGGSSFSQILNDAVGEVNKLQNEALRDMEEFALGKVDDIHKPIIAMEKASIALELLVQVRNKAVEAYQEIMRMQI